LTAAVPDTTALAGGAPSSAPWQCGDDSYRQVDIAAPDSMRLPDSQP
jgi:hypothetical protein